MLDRSPMTANRTEINSKRKMIWSGENFDWNVTNLYKRKWYVSNLRRTPSQRDNYIYLHTLANSRSIKWTISFEQKIPDDEIHNELTPESTIFKLGMRALKKKKPSQCAQKESDDTVAKKPLVPRTVMDFLASPAGDESSKILHVRIHLLVTLFLVSKLKSSLRIWFYFF